LTTKLIKKYRQFEEPKNSEEFDIFLKENYYYSKGIVSNGLIIYTIFDIDKDDALFMAIKFGLTELEGYHHPIAIIAYSSVNSLKLYK